MYNTIATAASSTSILTPSSVGGATGGQHGCTTKICGGTAMVASCESALRENGKKINDKKDIQNKGVCFGCERKAPQKMEGKRIRILQRKEG